ncbi:MAG: vanadium-dependent haloperoxidase [Bacteroidota bacterium]
MKKKLFIAIAAFVLAPDEGLFSQTHKNYLVRCNEKLVEVVMEDLFNPPVSSRVYVYPNIAAYEVLCLGNPQLRSLNGQIKHLPKLNLEKTGNINYSVAADFAFTTVAKKLVFTERMITVFEQEEKNNWKKQNLDTNLINASAKFGIMAGKQIIDWILKDNYIQIKAMERYVLQEDIGCWRPTAPEYMNALEPNWPYMRPLVMDSARQIRSAPNLVYSEKKTSDFYKAAYEVYKTAQSLDTVQKTIALFWDCNPNISMSRGHITYFVHKISPGGHWIKIAGQACRNLNFDETKTAETYALLTIGLYDAFLSCWAEKFTSHGIRPETYINRLIDAKWLPYIQTPPFPEYTSGHSVISNASSYILTRVIPQPYTYTDSSEMYIGIPPRSFKSFEQASAEAGISRMYGGIHFMPAITNGAEQGIKVGKLVMEKIKTRK